MSSFVFSSDLEILIGKNDDGLIAEITPKNGIDVVGFGAIAGDRVFCITIRNDLGKEVRIGEWSYQEDCFKFKVLPRTVRAKGEEFVQFSIDMEGLSGGFNKNIVCQIEIEANKRDVEIPVKFTVSDENQGISKEKTTEENLDKADELGFQIEFRDYEGGGMNKYTEAKAWIFAGKNCSGCNYLKRILLPQLLDTESFKKKPVVIEVDIDKKENFLLLIGIEEKLRTESDKTPILYWEDKLIYGNESVEAMIKDISR